VVFPDVPRAAVLVVAVLLVAVLLVAVLLMAVVLGALVRAVDFAVGLTEGLAELFAELVTGLFAEALDVTLAAFGAGLGDLAVGLAVLDVADFAEPDLGAGVCAAAGLLRTATSRANPQVMKKRPAEGDPPPVRCSDSIGSV
jgi:hypothetical protein